MFPRQEKMGSWKTMGGLIFHQTNGKVVPTYGNLYRSVNGRDGLLSKVFINNVLLCTNYSFINRL
jgi:hypothetical protein